MAQSNAVADPILLAKLTDPLGEPQDTFSYSATVFRDIIVIGSRLGDGEQQDSGSALIYRYDGTSLIQQARLVPSDPISRSFGASVAAYGEKVVVGAPGYSQAYVYSFDGTRWNEEARLTAPGGLGASVAIDGDRIVIGAPGGDVRGAYVFHFDGAQWIQEAKLLPRPGPEDLYGWSVSISGDTIVVGAPFDDDNGDSSGAAFIYRFDGASWVEQAHLIGPSQWDDFGISVAASGTRVLIGAREDNHTNGSNSGKTGSAYTYRLEEGSWRLEARLSSSDAAPGDFFGESVALQGDLASVGAKLNDDHGDQSGSAYIFRFDGVVWREVGRLLAEDGAAYDHFGVPVSISDNVAVVGAPGSSSLRGSAYVFRLLPSCADRTDNDGDGLVDFPADSGCADENQDLEDPSCDDAIDNDGDGLVDAGEDLGCESSSDPSERSPILPCDDGVDNDGDGSRDFVADSDADGIADPPGDPGCLSAVSTKENPECQDGRNNDFEAGLDFDGGRSVWGTAVDNPDPECIGRPWRDRERPGRCGLGAELSLPLLALAWLYKRRRWPAGHGRRPSSAAATSVPRSRALLS